MIASSVRSRRAPIGWRLDLWFLSGIILGSSLVGCGSTEVETTYGRSRGLSINGTNAFAELLRAKGHSVRAAVRYNEILGHWAAVLIRFAPHSGPPSRDEAEWLSHWLDDGPGRKLIYIPRDYAANAEFWARMLQATPPGTTDAERQAIQARRDAAPVVETVRSGKSNPPADARKWFATEPTNRDQPAEVSLSQHLDGPWAEGVDSAAAALPVHESIRADNDENVLLTGDGKKLVVAWTDTNDESAAGQVLIVANGSFLLNAALLNKARRPLATRVVDWVGDGSSHVAFVEGAYALDEDNAAAPSPFHLLMVEPFGWITTHLAIFGGLLCLALAAPLGRSCPEPPSAIERPSAHPVALGAILARTRQGTVAHETLVAYRRWRHPSAATPRIKPASPSSRRVPHA